MSELFKRATKYLGSHRGVDIPAQELNNIEQKVASRRKAGRYTLEEAAMYIADKGKTAPVSMLNKLIQAKALRTLNTYRPDDNGIHIETMLVRQWSDEVYWNEINDWLLANESNIRCIFPDPNASATNAKIEPVPVATSTAVENKSGLTKREQQIQVIESFADELKYKRLAIPNGGKKILMDKCKSEKSGLFGTGNDPFNAAWKEASKARRVQIKNREKYLKR